MFAKKWRDHNKSLQYLDSSVWPDGVTKQLLYGNVMFKQATKYKSNIVYDLVPYKHFIPWIDENDLFAKVKFYLDAININNNNAEKREKMIGYLTYIALNGLKYALEKFNSDYLDCHSINMFHLYANTFKNINIDATTLDKKIKYNLKNHERWLSNRMNKTIVLNRNLTDFRIRNQKNPNIPWPKSKSDATIIQTIKNMIDNNIKQSKLAINDLDRFNYDKLFSNKQSLLEKHQTKSISNEIELQNETENIILVQANDGEMRMMVSNVLLGCVCLIFVYSCKYAILPMFRVMF